ncbi:MAG: hypothetical protein ACREHF_08500 [Rhizomicrobium sp.]
MLIAALSAAALVASGTLACALTDAPAAPFIDAPLGSAPSDNTAPIVAPDLTILVGVPGAPSVSHSTFAATGPLGLVSASADTQSLALPPALANGRAPPDMLRDLAIADTVSDGLAVHFGYDVDLGREFEATDVRGEPEFAGLFLAPADFNTSGFGESGISAGASFGLGHGVSLDLGGTLSGADRPSLLPPMPYPAGADTAFDRNARQSVLAGVDWKFAPWAGVALAASHQAARSGFIGSAASLDALSLVRSTNAVGATGRVAFGSGWVTSFSYNQGVTQLDLRPGGNLVAANNLRSRSYGIAVAKHGLFGDDALGLAVSRPLDPQSGIDLGGVASADPFDGFIAANTHPILAGQTAETDLQLGYVTTFMDGALALQANAGYQMNAAGQNGNNGLTVLSRAKINF